MRSSLFLNRQQQSANSSALLLFMVMSILLLPQLLVANHDALTQLQQQRLSHEFIQNNQIVDSAWSRDQLLHQAIHSQAAKVTGDLSVGQDLVHDITTDHSHESVSLFANIVPNVNSLVGCHFTGSYQCLNQHLPPPEYPPKA